MFIVIFTNAPTFHSYGCVAGEGYVGPFSDEKGARHWTSRNTEDGATVRIVSLVDIAEATLA